MSAIRKTALLFGFMYFLLEAPFLWSQKYGINTSNYLGVNAGVVYSTFGFTSEEESDKLNIGYKPGLQLGVSYSKPFADRHSVGAEINILQGGAKAETEFSSVRYDLFCVGGSMYYGYNVLVTNTYAFEPGIHCGADAILGGEQIVNGRRTLIKVQNTFQLWSLKGGLTLKNYFYFQDYTDFMLEYRYSHGLNNVEGNDAALGQVTHQHYHMLNIGVRIRL